MGGAGGGEGGCWEQRLLGTGPPGPPLLSCGFRWAAESQVLPRALHAQRSQASRSTGCPTHAWLQCSDGDAHWQTGSSASQSMADTQWRWGMGWSPRASQQAQLDRAWGRIVLQSTTLRSSQEASGLVRESFPEAALVPGCGPDVCNVWSTQASGAVETPSSGRRLDRCLCVPAGALQIESSEESDQGKYECVATNSAGTRYSAPANLYVRGKDSGGAQP